MSSLPSIERKSLHLWQREVWFHWLLLFCCLHECLKIQNIESTVIFTIFASCHCFRREVANQDQEHDACCKIFPEELSRQLHIHLLETIWTELFPQCHCPCPAEHCSLQKQINQWRSLRQWNSGNIGQIHPSPLSFAK